MEIEEFRRKFDLVWFPAGCRPEGLSKERFKELQREQQKQIDDEWWASLTSWERISMLIHPCMWPIYRRYLKRRLG